MIITYCKYCVAKVERVREGARGSVCFDCKVERQKKRQQIKKYPGRRGLEERVPVWDKDLKQWR